MNFELFHAKNINPEQSEDMLNKKLFYDQSQHTHT